MTEHGTRSRYINHGCRCEACKRANTEYARGRNAHWMLGRYVPGQGYLRADGSIRRTVRRG